MKIFTGKTEIDYSVSNNGYFIEKIKVPAGTLMRATPDVTTFLEWMVQPVADEIERREQMKHHIKVIKAWWGMPDKENHKVRGHFNMDHYKKVLQARLIQL